MNYLLSFAFKNLFRHLRRTVITSLALAFGIMCYILVDSLLEGAKRQSERSLVDYETGSARIVHVDWWEEHERLPLNYVIEEPEALMAVVHGEGIAATPRTLFAGELIVHQEPYPEDGSIVAVIRAIDPSRDNDVYRFRDRVVEGRWLQPGENGVLLGGWLAEDIGAEVGYPLTISTRTRQGYRQTIDVEVVGIIDCPNPNINRNTVLLPLDVADLYLQMEGAVTEIGLLFPNDSVVPPPFEGLRSLVAGLHFDWLDWQTPFERDFAAIDERLAATTDTDLLTRRELAPDYYNAVQGDSVGNAIILLLIFIIAAVGVSNTMLMTIYERVRELGMMRALGMSARAIRRLFLLEAAGIGIIGGIGGAILGALFNILLVERGINYGRWTREIDIGYRIQDVFYGAWNLGTFASAFLIGVVIAVVFAFLPTRRALRKGIPDCLGAQ